nr:Biomphalaria glabrata chaoptin-like [Biomphalaria glabrata]
MLYKLTSVSSENKALQLLLGHFCLVTSASSLLLGHFCMVTFAWSLLHGHFCMVTSASSLLHGHLCMVISAWSLLHGYFSMIVSPRTGQFNVSDIVRPRTRLLTPDNKKQVLRQNISLTSRRCPAQWLSVPVFVH